MTLLLKEKNQKEIRKSFTVLRYNFVYPNGQHFFNMNSIKYAIHKNELLLNNIVLFCDLILSFKLNIITGFIIINEDQINSYKSDLDSIHEKRNLLNLFAPHTDIEKYVYASYYPDHNWTNEFLNENFYISIHSKQNNLWQKKLILKPKTQWTKHSNDYTPMYYNPHSRTMRPVEQVEPSITTTNTSPSPIAEAEFDLALDVMFDEVREFDSEESDDVSDSPIR